MKILCFRCRNSNTLSMKQNWLFTALKNSKKKENFQFFKKEKEDFYGTLARSSLATLTFPYLAARWRGVNPFFVVAAIEAPCSSNIEATWRQKKSIIHYSVSIFGRQMEGCEAFLRGGGHRGAMLQQNRGHLAVGKIITLFGYRYPHPHPRLWILSVPCLVS
jgi:hypothetical protein